MDAMAFSRRQRAAALIQAMWRGYRARKAYTTLKQAARKIQAHAKGWYTRKKLSDARERSAMEAKFQATMARHRERIYMWEQQKRLVQEQAAPDIDIWLNKRNKAAAKVQAAWRGRLQRKRFAQMDPERAKKEAAANEIHRAFKQIVSQAQAAHAQDASAAGAGVRPSSPLPPAVRQSATVLMGSPQRGVGLEGGLAAACGLRDQHMMSSKRYAELLKQVEEQVQAHKALARHRRTDAHTTNTRLKELLHDCHASAADRLAAAHARAAHVVALEALAGALDTGGLAPLASLQDPQPQQFPLPAKGSQRWERAVQAHALQLADARAGPAWWRHLQPLNRNAAQQALMAEEQERWQELDGQWRRQWARMEAMEARRPDPLAELNLRAPGTPKPRLSDIAEADTSVQLDSGRAHAAEMQWPGAGPAHAGLPPSRGVSRGDAGFSRDQGAAAVAGIQP